MEADEVHRVLEALKRAGIPVGITGGWGIDALLGYERRPHQDLDLGIDAGDVEMAIGELAQLGYRVVLDERPGRLELSARRGRVDLHPIAWDGAGNGIQTVLGGGRFLYPAGSLDARGMIDGKPVRCGTPDLQVSFHLGYPPTDQDRHDMAALARALGIQLPPPYSS